MAAIFTGGRWVFFFFCWIFLHANPVCHATSTFQDQGTVTLVPVCIALLPEECRCMPESARLRVCVERLATSVGVPTCNELESAVSSFFGSRSAWSFSTMMWKRHGAGLLLRQAKRVIQRLVISKRSPQDRKQCGILVHVEKTSSAKRLLVRGEVERYCHWHGRRLETADQLGENESSKKERKRPTFQFQSWSRKPQEAKMMHDLLRPAEITMRRSSSAAHIYAHLDSRLKRLVNSQGPFPLRDFYSSTSLVISRSRSTDNWPRTERRQKVSGAKLEKECPVASKHGRSG